jgi:hypothetical protein
MFVCEIDNFFRFFLFFGFDTNLLDEGNSSVVQMGESMTNGPQTPEGVKLYQSTIYNTIDVKFETLVVGSYSRSRSTRSK